MKLRKPKKPTAKPVAVSRSPRVQALAKSVGMLILNAAALEWATYVWIEQLSDEPALLNAAKRLQFKQRVSIVQDLIDQCDWGKDRKRMSKDCWNKVLKLFETRNLVAHNPVLSLRRGRVVEFGVVPAKKVGNSPDGSIEEFTQGNLDHTTRQLAESAVFISAFLRGQKQADKSAV